MLKTSKDYQIYRIELLQIIKETIDTVTFIFSLPDDLLWDEGAHTHLALDKFNEEIGWFDKKNVRHFSIMTLPSEKYIGITTRLRPLCTEFKAELKKASVGDQFYLFKVGSRLTLKREGKPIILLSQGVGIASLRPVIKTFCDDSTNVPRVHHINVDSSKDYLFTNELKEFSKKSLFSYEYTQSRNEFYTAIKSLLTNKSSELYKEAYIYIIGSDEFLVNVRDYLLCLGISKYQMIIDKKETIDEVIKNG